ncbi:hypothetical protein LEMLEM_LOCUS10010 [Lemmus lemmus]
MSLHSGSCGCGGQSSSTGISERDGVRTARRFLQSFHSLAVAEDLLFK